MKKIAFLFPALLLLAAFAANAKPLMENGAGAILNNYGAENFCLINQGNGVLAFLRGFGTSTAGIMSENANAVGYLGFIDEAVAISGAAVGIFWVSY